MKRPLLETEKNFLQCAVIMLLVGLSMIALGKSTWGIICIVIAVVFVGIAMSMIIKENKNDK